ncbi:hypothetical protein [Methylobacterium sp. Leaf89]|uniref:hypothetical protein n=1 Tax=Methylobacterium sp. Leaf89 TaxID=1736245 RepID=UPI0006FD3D4B|nr:hypothetical protein [Methylobacterium sp. Leaf89]KQO67243.1 hypothetical protein ASF18_11265 [Methylobacterium sp. Leaf89]
MTTSDYEAHIAMTPEQKQEWWREQKRDTQRLGQEITDFLQWLCEHNTPHEHRNHNGMWNCQSWLLPALDRNGIAYRHTSAQRHLAETISFTLHDATLTMAEYDVSVNTTHGNADDEDDNDPHFLGTVLELNLTGSTPKTNFRMGVRWFAYDNEAAGNGMTVDDWYQRRWAFPAPVWCHMLGNNDHARSWLMLAKLSMKV